MKYPFVNLVLEGGGVWGIAYVSVLEELETREILPRIKRVSGTSAGSIIALLLALGNSAAEIRSKMENLDFTGFQDDGGVLQLASRYGYYRGDFAHDFLRDAVEERLDDGDATFADLNNKGGLDLHVHATNLSTQRVKEFSFAKTPDISLALAVRASMSIPLLFDAVNIDGQILVDGGVVLNYPIFGLGRLEETLGLAFGGVDAGGANDDSAEFGYNTPLEFVQRLFGALISGQSAKWLLNETVQRHTILINTGAVSLTNFNLTQDDKHFLLEQGRLAAQRFFERYDKTDN